MPDLTPRIGIKKPLGNENVSRASFNENWDIIDAKVATLGVDGKVPANQLTGQNTFSNVAGKTGGTINTVVAEPQTLLGNHLSGNTEFFEFIAGEKKRRKY